MTADVWPTVLLTRFVLGRFVPVDGKRESSVMAKHVAFRVREDGLEAYQCRNLRLG
ncbi:hypothetical protein [Acetobacter sp.]|uniref:hypothetical protein n=1 Tax=Acetobacter sp. TaxID=440 RepID=UPI0039ECEFC2